MSLATAHCWDSSSGPHVQKRSTGRARHIRPDVPHCTGYKHWLTRGNLSIRREERSSQTQEDVTQSLVQWILGDSIAYLSIEVARNAMAKTVPVSPIAFLATSID